MFDDFTSIANNDAMSYPLDSKHFFAMLASGPGYLHRPLSTLSFYLDSYCFGLSPAAFKLTNIGIHIIAGLSLGAMMRDLLKLYRTRGGVDISDTRINWLAFITTALWLVHPINFTAVLYVVQRETALSTIFTAAAVWAYLRGRQLQLTGDKRASWLFWALVPLLTLLGIACKENAALIPLFLFLIEFTLLGFKTNQGRISRELLAFFCVFLFIPGCLALLMVLRGNSMLMGGYLIRDFTLSERLMTECRVILLYLRWIAFPELQQLGLYHDDIASSHGLLSPASTLLSIIGMLVLLAGALLLRKRSPWLSLGILWFFAGHIVESSVLPLELVFEHRNYLPLYGLIMGVVAAIGCSRVSQQHARPFVLLTVMVIVIYSGLTSLRAMEWASPPEFAQNEARHHPQSPRAQSELGSVLIAAAMNGVPQVADDAAAAMTRARALDKNSISEDLSLAIMYSSLKDPQSVSKYLRDAADRAGTIIPNAETQTSLQSVLTYAQSNEGFPFDDMSTVFTRVLANPHSAPIPCFTAGIWNSYSVFLQDNGRIPQAMTALHQALELCPVLTDVRVNYARNLIAYGDFKDAHAQIALIEAANTYGRYTAELEELKGGLAEVEKRSAASPRR
ncbi:MAG TPA: hypothetical protein VGT99_10420 [Gammaproteobacteria bacterium]|nr:hypothetical protein [Gammaproteobacteria bacterium]